ETCDDGNTTSSDGCSNTCQEETGWTCTGTGPGSCTPDCGDGLLVSGEICDGALLNGHTCTTEFGYSNPTGLVCNSTCTGFDDPGSCSNTCGDGQVEPGETCDDNNTSDTDGCDSSCQPETGWTCDGASPTNCTPDCGDSMKVGGETCDDGNSTPNDGCDENCHTETGYICTGTGPGSCSPDCGDGLIVTGETCDGTNFDGDTCNDYGYTGGTLTCTNSCTTIDDSNCSSSCPNSQRETDEECDDGNSVDGDGCDSGCNEEPNWTCTNTLLAQSTCTCDNDDACDPGYECDGSGCVAIPEDTCPGEALAGNITSDSSRMLDDVSSWDYDSNTYQADGPDMYYNINLDAGDFIIIRLLPDQWDGVLVLTDDNCGTPTVLDISDFSAAVSGEEGELIHYVAPAAGNYVIVVDGYDAADSGSFTLEVIVGQAVTPDENSEVVINEVKLRPSSSYEWIEFYNGDGTDYNLKDLRLRSDRDDNSSWDYDISIDEDIILPANGYVVLGTTRSTSSMGGIDNVAFAFSGGTTSDIFSSDGIITIATSDGTMIDTIDYDDNANSWPDNKDTECIIGLYNDKDNKTDNDDGSNWCRKEIPRGTPGEENTSVCD
ncbi:MAG: DUF4215 domain-containing protein, partial [Deltaproteobacteria bacterium]|nr:DUF4215 domain-containing protein [Deltaproteobacteria bacterium]